jgi:Flavin containing amine oxidoreductase
MVSKPRTAARSTSPGSSTPTDHDLLDVAIVGGGVSGVYSCWRLLTAPQAKAAVPPRIALFESSSRIGGRLLSVVPPGIPDTRVELGGMRFPSSHKRVKGLVAHFGLTVDPFPVAEPQNLVYVRGRRLRRQELGDAAKIPYLLAPDEQGSDTLAAGFTALGATRALRVIQGSDRPELKDVDWKQIAETDRFDGHRLRDLPMQYVLQRNISQEAYKFAEDTSGYDSILHTWNAADGLPWNLADFGASISYFHVREGYDVLPRMMAEGFKKAGGVTHLGQTLVSFDQVSLADGTPAIALRLVDRNNTARTQMARRLILAMPRRALELLDRSGAVLAPGNRDVHELIGSVKPIPLFKLAICYSFPWWETLDAIPEQSDGGKPFQPITQGQSITDLPLRQCYYWAVDKETRNAVVLIYDDGSDLDFWAGLRDRHKSPKLFPSVSAGVADSGSPGWNEHSAPRLMVEEAHRQLLEMHGVQDRADIPRPYAAAYRDWGEDPYGGGANFWPVNVDSVAVFRDILQPKPPVPVYICGEAYSNFQGWVEGPLETADKMLQVHFGLAPPPWLSEQAQ